ncbi:uncharacterized protein METZ01_LOCUS409303, partial [marine metagenome]
TVTVEPTNDAPVLSEIGDLTLDEDTVLEVTLFATDVDGTDSLTFSVLDDNLISLNASVNGNILEIDPSDNYNGGGELTITVTDNVSRLTDAEIVTVTVNPVNDAPTITSVEDHVHDVVNSGSAYTQTMVADDIDVGDMLTWSVTSIPDDIGMTIGETTGIVTWTADTDPSIFEVTYTVKINDGTVDVYETVQLMVYQYYDCTYDPENDTTWEDGANGIAVDTWCDNSCGVTGPVIDECGVCDGDGILDGACDCDGNINDCAGVCAGDAEDEDGDGICN